MGHVGSDALDASSYSDLYTQSSGVFITAGSLGVFTGQAYGAKNYKMVGVWLQVAYASIAIVAIPVVALWAVTGPALKAFGVDPKLANMAWYVTAQARETGHSTLQGLMIQHSRSRRVPCVCITEAIAALLPTTVQ